MTIAIGDPLPAATFRIMGPDGATDLTTEDLTRGKRVVLFGVPGAFTPTCSNNHLPGYLEHHDEIMERGVDTVAVVAVNDVFVMEAWAKHTEAAGKIVFLADGSATFTRAVGLDNDSSGFGMGVRSKRYSMLIEDGVVRQLNIEDKPGVDVSGADALLKSL